MAGWGEFAEAAPELAAFGAERFVKAEVAYLATVRDDGSPRVHPVTPFIGGGRLFLFIGATSPKGRDLRHNARYALHSLVTDQHGSGGEFTATGSARIVDDSATRQIATEAVPYPPEEVEGCILFELAVDGASSTIYRQGESLRRRWGKR